MFSRLVSGRVWARNLKSVVAPLCGFGVATIFTAGVCYAQASAQAIDPAASFKDMKQTKYNSFWLHNAPPALASHRSSPELPKLARVVVVGGGLTGCSAAYHLAKLDVDRVVLLEARTISSGATGRNGGHLTLGSESRAKDVFDFTVRNMQGVLGFMNEHKVDLDYRQTGFVWLAVTPEQAAYTKVPATNVVGDPTLAQFISEAQAKQETGCEVAKCGILRPAGGQFWPAKLVFALADKALGLGVNVQCNTPVLSVETLKDGVIVHTARGDIKADYVVHATNAWASQLVPSLKDVVKPVRGQMLCTEPLPMVAKRNFACCSAPESEEEYLIQRGDGRMVFGGCRHLSPTLGDNGFDDNTIDPEVSAGLRALLASWFSSVARTRTNGTIKVDYEWTGIMGFTPDGYPLLGPLPADARQFIAAGYTGSGMNKAFMAGRAVAEWIHSGQRPSYIPAGFSPTRFDKTAANPAARS